MSHLLGLLLTLSAAAPGALPLPAIEAREAAAKAACTAGRVEEGVLILTELNARTGDSGYIFNEARCYQQNGRKEQALARFREYLQQPDITPAARARAEQHVAELGRAPAQAPPRTASPIETPAVAPATPVAETSAGESRPLSVAALAVAGAGVVALGAATYFALRVRDIGRERDRLLTPNEPVDPSRLAKLDRDGESAENWQWVCLGTGATALATAALLYYLDRRAPAGTDRTHLTPALFPGGGGAVLQGRF